MTFFYPKLLWLLAIPALMLVWDILRIRKSGRVANGAPGNKILAATARASSVRLVTKPAAPVHRLRSVRWYLAMGLACACVALARPQWGRIEEPVFDQSREILIAVDLSRSMLAEDVKPNRLERSRLLIESLLGELKGERVGLIVFAGTAFLQAPLSSDYEILREFLSIIGPDYLPQAGTNYEAMLRTAGDSYGQSAADRFLIVLSDGEADPASPWRELAEECKKRDIKAITLGVGTQNGAMISGEDGNLLKDERGAVVLSRLEPATLQELADVTGGTYTDASQWVDVAELIKATVAKGAKGEFREAERIRLAERFQWALGPAILFILLSLWREFPVQPHPRRIALSVARTIPVLLACVLLISGTSFAVSQGNSANDPASILSPLANQEQAPPTVDTSETAKKLSELVGHLSAQDAISSQDAVALAEATLAYGQPLREQGRPVPNGPVDDALEAVNQAAQKEPAAANWAELRSRLEALRQKPPSESQQQKQEQEKKDQEQQKDQNQKDQKDQGGQGKSQENQDQKQQQQDKQNSSDQSQKSESSSDQQNKQDSNQQKDSKSESPENESKQQQDQQSGSSSENQQQQKQQQSDSGKKSDEQKTDSPKTDNTSGKDNQGKPTEPPKAKGEKFFDSMQDKPGDQNPQSPQKQLPAPEPATTENNQKVGGVAAEGTPLDKNVDPNLLVPLQRLERAKAGDLPGILFRRMQTDQPEKQSNSGRNW